MLFLAWDIVQGFATKKEVLMGGNQQTYCGVNCHTGSQSCPLLPPTTTPSHPRSSLCLITWHIMICVCVRERKREHLRSILSKSEANFFKVYLVMNWYMYILWNDNYSKISWHNPWPHTITIFFVVVIIERAFKIYSVSNLLVCNIVLLKIVTVL